MQAWLTKPAASNRLRLQPMPHISETIKKLGMLVPKKEEAT
jgi:hypothetical protein